jgi:putative transposase
MRDVGSDFGAVLAELPGDSGRVHLLVNVSPEAAASRLVSSLTGVWSCGMRQEFPGLADLCWRAPRLWSLSWFAGSAGGAPICVLHQYTGQQDRPA